MKSFAGKLSDDTGVVCERIMGAYRKLPSNFPAWSGQFSLPNSLLGRLREGSRYRLDIAGDLSIMVMIAGTQVRGSSPEDVVRFESMGNRLA